MCSKISPKIPAGLYFSESDWAKYHATALVNHSKGNCVVRSTFALTSGTTFITGGGSNTATTSRYMTYGYTGEGFNSYNIYSVGYKAVTPASYAVKWYIKF